MNKKKMYLWAALGLLLLGVLFSTSQRTKISVIEGEWDISQEVKSNGYEIYLVETSDFDYTNPAVYNVAQEIKARTLTPEEAIEEVLKFVVQNIQYSSSVSVDSCFEETASTALQSGVGDCVSMARLATALLRAQGIPARTMGGCLSGFSRCTPIFAVVPTLEAQVTPMIEGDFKKRGFLHEWVEAWYPDNSDTTGKWHLLESTSGQIFDMSCISYLEFGYDSNPRDRCVITSPDFWRTCKNY